MPADPQRPMSDTELDALVRRVDEDRWLASRFASTSSRQRLTALYAVNYEIARTAESVREPALGAIRLQWWREALAEVAAGGPARAHPTLAAYARAHRDSAFSLALWDELISARQADLEPSPFDTVAALDDYIGATAGNLMRLAVGACGGDPESYTVDRLVFWAGRVWGCTGLLRAEAHWTARGRSFLPRQDPSGAKLRQRVASAMRELRALPAPDASIFPAIGYVRLAGAYLRSARQALILRQLKLIAAAATGRI